MKILKWFDTKIDAEELTEAINKHGQWNVILVKRHRIKLVLPLFCVFLSILLLNIMLYAIYIHVFEENKTIFRILATFYVYTTISRSCYTIFGIMANIIGQIQAKKKYIDDGSLAEIKQKTFERFLKRSFITFLIHVIVLIFNATVPFIIIHNTWLWSIGLAVWVLILDIIFLIVVNRVMFQLIEYEMNFWIYTADKFTLFNQKWFFKTDITNISTSAIKIIQSSKEWISWALLEYWDINIYTDGNITGDWNKTLKLSYIPDPKRLVKKLNLLIEKPENPEKTDESSKNSLYQNISRSIFNSK